MFNHLWLPDTFKKVHRWLCIYVADVEMGEKKKKRRILPGFGAAFWGVGKTKETDGESIVET